MSDQRFSIVCTGRGDHGRIDCAVVILAEDGSIREVLTRQAPSPVRGVVDGGADSGAPLSRKAVVPAEGHRSGSGTWRWKCPRCRIDKRLTEDHLRAWTKVTTGDVLDISRLPR